MIKQTKKTNKPGILGDKTVGDKFMYTRIKDKQNYPSCTLKLFVEKFGSWKVAGFIVFSQYLLVI